MRVPFCLWLIVLLAPLAVAAPARADDAVATVTADTPVVGTASTVAWLTAPADGSAGRVIAYREGGGAPVTTTVHARSDLGAGQDARGRETLTWSVCSRGAARCPVYAYRPGQQRARVLARVRRERAALNPVLAGRRLVTARRVGRSRCDAPFVTRLGSSSPARRLRTGACGQIARLAVDGSRVLVGLSGLRVRYGNGREQLRSVPLGGGASRELADVVAGEAPNDIAGFGSFLGTVTYALPGGFGRRPLFGQVTRGKTRRLQAYDALAGGLTVVGRRPVFLRAGTDAAFADEACTAALPCTIVAAGDPRRPRTLVRRVLVDGDGSVVAGGSTITGRVDRRRVGPDRVRRTIGQAGVVVELYATGDADPDGVIPPTVATPTGIRATTDAAGRYALAVPADAPEQGYVVRTADDGVPATGYALP